ncbi:MAG TPA: hypothetical protein VKB14_16140 [Actinomycetales bacterium]|nr:hypothetical protein [Actinomycetales bacterium]
MRSTVLLLHVAHGFSAQPTLSAQLAVRSAIAWQVLELEPAEVMHREHVDPAVVWASRADPAQTADLRLRLPSRPLLVSLPRHSQPALVVRHYDLGADLVIEDEGVTYAAAAIAALGRRLAGRPPSAELPPPAGVQVARG